MMQINKMEKGVKIKSINELESMSISDSKECAICCRFLTRDNESNWLIFDSPCTLAKQCIDCFLKNEQYQPKRWSKYDEDK